jgi:aryl-alcohol dehydrogenase-like predicted oxidoreductase
VKYDHPHGGPIQSVRLPFVLGDEPREAGTPPPLRGEHTQAILREMGFSSQQIKELRAVEAIARAFHSPMCPLGKGFLTGKIDQSTKFVSTDFRNVLPHFTPKARQASQALIALLAKFAEHRNATPAQIALAWLLAQKPWIVPIPGTTKLARLKENIGVAAIELTADDPREVESSSAEIHGARADRLSSPRDRSAA